MKMVRINIQLPRPLKAKLDALRAHGRPRAATFDAARTRTESSHIGEERTVMYAAKYAPLFT